MKLKYIIVIILVIMIIISISQIFSIPPFAEDIFQVYKSGYFDELERSFDIIKEAFLGIKMMSKPVYAWIFLEDVGIKHNIDIKVYDDKGLEVLMPGGEKGVQDDRVIRILNSLSPKVYSQVIEGRYYSAIPVFLEDRCRFCHSEKDKEIIGVVTFERGYDSYIYYSSERVIIFVLLSLLLLFLLYLVMRWDPGKIIKELFDKT